MKAHILRKDRKNIYYERSVSVAVIVLLRLILVLRTNRACRCCLIIQVLRTEKARAADFSSQTICYSLSSGSSFTREAFQSILSSFYLVIFFGCVRRIFFSPRVVLKKENKGCDIITPFRAL